MPALGLDPRVDFRFSAENATTQRLERVSQPVFKSMQTESAPMLRVQDLAVDIQGSPVLRGVSFEVGAGELVCLVGRNGAGKTTSFRTVLGFRQPADGTIQFDGR